MGTMTEVQREVNRLVTNTNMDQAELDQVLNDLCQKYGTEVVAEAWMRQSVVRPQ